MLDLRRLRLLREVEARNTLSAAAEALGYTTSAVSQQLSVLEREAGTALLERVGRNVRLTDAGRVLVRHAQTLLDAAEAAEAEVAEVAAGQVAEVVKVASFQSAFLRIVAPAVRDLATSHPHVRVEASEQEVEQAVPGLRLQHLDVVVGDEYDDQPRPVHGDLARTDLVRERVRLVMPADHPLARRRKVPLTKLAGQSWAACQPGTGHREMQVRICRQLGGFEPDLRHASDDFLILIELVRTTGACALLPDLVLGYAPSDWTPGVVVRDLVEGSIGRTVFMLARTARTPAVAVVTDALRRSAAGA
ncbi:LysR family transcriptional regulator [Nocardioides agariphilus]|uniref:LysR family transcriptional regulator n=1 Tax=Nocardioides agariphilus TaxID=433664 RepID=A0A930YIK9_9ACTN|nr:LysR family transcriptional regulator [Nocardioides agariphilus]MBF4769826.1 LysR family transcriptional regulator [Nocardioides agariphilus]